MQHLSGSTVGHSFSKETASFLSGSLPGGSDVICLSRLRWNYVDPRSQQVLYRCAKTRRVFFVEEPRAEFIDSWWLEVSPHQNGVWLVVPHLLDWVCEELAAAMHQSLMDQFVKEYAIVNPIFWYYTSTEQPLTGQLTFVSQLRTENRVQVDGSTPVSGLSDCGRQDQSRRRSFS